MRISIMIAAAALAASPVFADDSVQKTFGGDVYQAGRSVSVTDAAKSIFAAGEAVTQTADIPGSAHMAGREVVFEGSIGGNVYGAGMDVDLYSAVAGDASVMGYDVAIHNTIDGNLRATGTSVDIGHQAKIAGSALLAGDTVTISGEIEGDVAVAAQALDWSDSARVGGTLEIYTDVPDEVVVPAHVAAPENIIVHDASQWDEDHGEGNMHDSHDYGGSDHTIFRAIKDFVTGVIAVGVIATLVAVIAPNWVANLRGRTLADPARATWYGFLGLSALVGSVVSLAVTGVGIILIPFVLIAAVLLGALGYVIGAYVVGVWALELAGRALPEDTGDRAMAAFAGAAILALIGFAPYLGWLVALAVAWAGAGSIVMGWFSIESHDRAA